MSNEHPWCPDVSRDTAVRAAEDAAASERPPLPEWRDLPERVAALEREVAAMKHDAAAAAVPPQAGSREDGGEAYTERASVGTANTSGLRTERVTLELSLLPECPPVTEWPWDKLALNYSLRLLPGQSVRVVPSGEAAAELERLRAERDAAKADAVAKWTAMNSAICQLRDVQAERDAALARVAELEKQLPEGMERCTITFHECGKGHGWLSATNWVQHPCQHCERDALKARVAELEKQLLDSRGLEARHREEMVTVEAMWEECGIAPDWPSDEPETPTRCAQSMQREIERLRTRVAELKEQADHFADAEPVAWGVVVHDGAVSDAYVHKHMARDHVEMLSHFNNADGKPFYSGIVPLFRAPPQPRGWLTREERKVLRDVHISFVNKSTAAFNANRSAAARQYTDEADIIHALLARNSPPRVRLPRVQADCNAELLLWNGKTLVLRDNVVAALAAAGVGVEG